MDIDLTPTKPNRISTSPPGRGMRARPDVLVNNDYVRQFPLRPTLFIQFCRKPFPKSVHCSYHNLKIAPLSEHYSLTMLTIPYFVV